MFVADCCWAFAAEVKMSVLATSNIPACLLIKTFKPLYFQQSKLVPKILMC